MSDTFYKELPGFGRFADLTDSAHYVDVPSGWHVVTTDIMGSTQAIAEGRYKEVNLVGAAVIMAVLNATGDTALPYAFGGDGATMLVPPGMADTVYETLGAVQARVKNTFGLDLRAGCVPIEALYRHGTWLKVGKFHLSEHISQAVFQGTALTLAEDWLKGNSPQVRRCRENGRAADLSGLECRWQPIDSRHGSMLSLLVRVTPSHAADSWRIYGEVLRDIEAIYPDDGSARPTYEQGMRLSFSLPGLSKETRLRAVGAWPRLRHLLHILVTNATGLFCILTGRRARSFDGSRYISELVQNSDARKFDEMLRMVIDSTPQQHKALTRMLAARQERGEIAYGIHASPRALMTCLVFSLVGRHVHFIDGADGGYALAAKQMKQKRPA